MEQNKHKRIGIMGGTFNPIHNAHLALAQCALEQCDLDEIMFLPSKIPPYKDRAEIMPDELRLALVKAAIEGNPKFYASNLELKREGLTYTADTMFQMSQMYENTDFFYIIGGDSLMSFDKWYHPEIIMKYTALLATGRGNSTREELEAKAVEIAEKFYGKVILFDAPAMDISSTQIRECLKNKKSIQGLVPERVEKMLIVYQGETK